MVNDAETNIPAGSAPLSPTRPPILKWIKFALSATILAATFVFLVRQISSAWSELQTRELHIHLEWALASAALYTVGMLILATPWHLTLRDRGRAIPGTPIFPYRDTVRVFFISQLGKYVPGKAVVIVIRYALLAKNGMTAGLATLTSFYETFCTMAAGSLTATLMLLLAAPTSVENALSRERWILPMALFFAVGFLVAILPPVFSLLPRVTSIALKSARKYADHSIAWSTCGQSLAAGFLAWSLLGLSFWATLKAVTDAPLSIDTVPAMTATFALSFVAGFVSMLPGQIGVREALLVVLLAPLVGGDNVVALGASILSRLVTVLAEVVVGGILYLTFPGSTANWPAPADPDTEAK